jgi:hypothetical protein
MEGSENECKTGGERKETKDGVMVEWQVIKYATLRLI